MGLKEYEIRGAEGCERTVIETANVLLIGDRVNLFADQPGAPFGWGTVVAVTEDEVEIHRPFIHTGDFSMSGKISPVGPTGSRLQSYMGQEVCRIPRHSDRKFTVVFRSTVPK